MCTWITRSKPCDEMLPITPVVRTYPDAKKQRMQGAVPAPPALPSSAMAPAPPPAPAPPRSSWGTGFGRGASDRQDSREAAKSKSKNLGDLVCASSFHLSLAPALAEKHCGRFCTIGKFCGRTGCTKNHLPTSRWPQEDKDLQMIYVDQNRDQLGFNADKVRWLPAEKRHLLKNPDGSSFGER